MDETKIQAYFEQQVRAIIGRSQSEPGGFRAYFAGREPKDEEILGLLAVTTLLSGESPWAKHFPTPVEALAALSPAARSEICRRFRAELKTCLQDLTSASSKVA